MLATLLRMAALPARAREMRDNATTAATNAAITAGLLVVAGVLGGIGMLCLSYAGLILLEREMDPASAWGIIGGIYATVAGALVYFAATRRRS